MNQISFYKFTKDRLFKKEMAFGGTLMRQAKFRTARPLSKKHPLHLVMSSTQAKGSWSFLVAKNYETIQKTVEECAAKNGIRVSELAINRDHIHLIIKFTNRTFYARFIRSLSGLLASRITNQGKRALDKRFWDYRPFTRIIIGFRGYQIAKDYVTLNKLEAMGVIDYQPERLRTVHRPLLN